MPFRFSDQTWHAILALSILLLTSLLVSYYIRIGNTPIAYVWSSIWLGLYVAGAKLLIGEFWQRIKEGHPLIISIRRISIIQVILSLPPIAAIIFVGWTYYAIGLTPAASWLFIIVVEITASIYAIILTGWILQSDD